MLDQPKIDHFRRPLPFSCPRVPTLFIDVTCQSLSQVPQSLSPFAPSLVELPLFASRLAFRDTRLDRDYYYRPLYLPRSSTGSVHFVFLLQKHIVHIPPHTLSPFTFSLASSFDFGHSATTHSLTYSKQLTALALLHNNLNTLFDAHLPLSSASHHLRPHRI